MNLRLPGLTLGLALSVCAPPVIAAPARVTADEAREIAVEAYLYAYPLVLMEVSRKVMSNAGEGAPAGALSAPMNQFHHMRTFPDASFTDVVRPNADTLYSSLWFDVSQEPLVIDVPDSGGRYYLLPMLDMWTDVFAVPGKRTTGTSAQTFAIVAPDWRGTLPKGVTEIRSPTPQGWMIGRTQTNGKKDYGAVRQFQDGLKTTPLSHWGKEGYVAPKGQFNPDQNMSPPVDQVARMNSSEFFATFAELLKKTPPHANDYPIRERMARIGIVPGQSFDLSKAPSEARSALEAAPGEGMKTIKAYLPRAGRTVNGWSMLMNPVGTYATDYLKRAMVACMGLGANVIEDAIYPTANGQIDGRPFDSGAKYVLHFAKEQIPPARAFWSLTMYNERQFFTDNSINRYAIGDRDDLKFNSDGSLDLYIQGESPGPTRETNWLPTPKSGSFSMNLRLYWPKPAALEGEWSPPPVTRAGETLRPTGTPAGKSEEPMQPQERPK